MLLVGASGQHLLAQVDTGKRLTVDSYIRKQKGIIGKLAKNLLADTSAESTVNVLLRNDLPFLEFEGLFIRHITVRPLDFGISIGDTTKALNNKLTRLVNGMHINTREKFIRRNLFFGSGSPLSSFLLGANERHLRDLSYITDARIMVNRVDSSPDSVDITVLTKDVYSLGGGFDMGRIDKVEVRVEEDNLAGRGDRLQLQTLFDSERKKRFGYGFELVRRNISGSFTDAYIGYKNFNRSFTTRDPEETISYVKLIKPLVHTYMKWTYAFEASINETVNMYSPDSVYQREARYKYSLIDAWAGWNISADKLWVNNNARRLNWLVGLRMLKKEFEHRPGDFNGKYFYRYSDFSAVLGAVSIFRQNFYKTQYIYGFGRNEDVPEGVDFSLTTGWTKKQGRERPYLALDYQRYFFTPGAHYFNFTVRGGSYFYQKKFEDVALLTGVDYFSRLINLSKFWKQRSFINLSASRQLSYRLNDPLLLESKYGLQGFDNDQIGGNIRLTAKGESVFYSPWAPLLFKLAPFVFGSTTLFGFDGAENSQRNLFTAFGGGIRTRNESLVFGTIELRGIYYPRPNFYNEHYRIEFNTNIRFRYNQQFIKRPELVLLN